MVSIIGVIISFREQAFKIIESNGQIVHTHHPNYIFIHHAFKQLLQKRLTVDNISNSHIIFSYLYTHYLYFLIFIFKYYYSSYCIQISFLCIWTTNNYGCGTIPNKMLYYSHQLLQ